MEKIYIPGVGEYDNSLTLDQQEEQVQAYVQDLMQTEGHIDTCDVCGVVNGQPVERPTQACYTDQTKGIKLEARYEYMYPAQHNACFALRSVTYSLKKL